jgi:hypothetical protein
VASVLVLGLIVAGCSVQAGVRVIEESGNIALVATNQNGGMDAQLVGTTAIESGCWGVVSEGEFILVVWPEGTDLQSHGKALRVAGGMVLLEGTSIIGGGGFDQYHLVEGLSGAENCPADQVVLLWTVIRAD